ncbi:Epsin-3, clathrin recruitment and traffic between the Golgi and endosome [Geranomyces variabilis]|nr:Epsin-3, clathrin recruitment and traffic between the Golgi and endosome [Geranomyces variabilis]
MDLDKLKGFVDVYSITSAINKVKNAVYNYTEFEIKVRDATNNEPWGASSTLMQEIASGTSHYTHFNEIMDTIYSRFHEKGGAEWRQIYKALQLLDYLIKNGSERVIDSVREHIYELKAMRSFQYIDEKGKDQGINVRHRAKEIAELLSDNEKIKAERKRAKENRQKYTGMSSGGSSGSRYGGYGSESAYGGGYGGGGGGGSSYGGYGNNGGGGGGGGGGFRDEDEVSPTRSSHSPSRAAAASSAPKPAAPKATVAPPAPAPAPVVDLLNMDSNDWGAFSGGGSSSATTSAATQKQAAAPAPPPDDDFADFQSAPAIGNAAPAMTGNGGGGFAAFQEPMGVSGGFGGNSGNSGNNNNAFGNQAAFKPPAPSNSNANFDLLGGFGGNSTASQAPMMSSQQPPLFAASFGQQPQQSQFQPQQQQQQQQQQKQATKSGNDAFSKLVSLDANALSGIGKREEQAGPSLNSMGGPAVVPSFAAFGSGFGAPVVPQQQQPNMGGFGAFGGGFGHPPANQQQQQQQQSSYQQQPSLF